MTAIRVNHVSVHAPDLEASVAWYRELFGARPIPTPNFGMPVQWLGIGDTQVHLFHRDADPPSHHHFAIAVDDFAGVYRRAGELGSYDRDAFGHHFFELPGDTAQLYLRDPGGNLVEIDWPDAAALDRTVVTGIRSLEDDVPQTGTSRSATLYAPK